MCVILGSYAPGIRKKSIELSCFVSDTEISKKNENFKWKITWCLQDFCKEYIKIKDPEE